MPSFILKRLLIAIPTLLVLVTLAFVMIRAAPGGPFSAERELPPQVLRNIEARYNLDKPLYQQYFIYIADLLRGDLGPSFRYRDFSVNDIVATAFPVSLRIGAWAFLVAMVFGVGLGTLAALKQNTWIDYTIMALAMTGVVLPSFVLGPVLIMIFSLGLGWLPAGGWSGGEARHMVLPVIAMALSYLAAIARLQRGSLIEVLGSNYIRTARAKGLSTPYIVWFHALRGSLLPVVSYMGPAFVGIITGSVVVETIFGLPGLGQHFVNGALNRDYTLVMGLTVLIGGLYILFTLIVDILYAVIDPKIRFS